MIDRPSEQAVRITETAQLATILLQSLITAIAYVLAARFALPGSPFA